MLKEKNLIKYNALTILMKTGSFIKMNELNDYNKTNLGDYQRLIEKLMYFTYRTRPNIEFVVEKLSIHNTDPRKSHLQAAKKVVY